MIRILVADEVRYLFTPGHMAATIASFDRFQDEGDPCWLDAGPRTIEHNALCECARCEPWQADMCTLAFDDPPRAVLNTLGIAERCRLQLSDRIANGNAFPDERIVRWVTLSPCACDRARTDGVRIDGQFRCWGCGHPVQTGGSQ